jgi:DNA repair ATPase RecN
VGFLSPRIGLAPAHSIESERHLAFLSELLLSNFRSFPNAQIDLDDHGLILIAGANNSGKSALLSAFDLIAGRGTTGEYKYVGASEVEVAASFTAVLPVRGPDRVENACRR